MPADYYLTNEYLDLLQIERFSYRAIANQRLGEIYFHEISDGMVDNFNAFIEFIAEISDNVVSYHEIFPN